MVLQKMTETGHRGVDRDLPDGIILIDKNEGETSFDVVKRIKRVTKRKKVGHAGTLDPFATGLLIILLGQGTKLSHYLMVGKKRYLAAIKLGIETDTLDKTGRVLRTCDVPQLEKEEVEENVRGFLGDIEQVPPLFSAVYHKGERAYKLARKGITVDLKKRMVRVHSVKIISMDIPEIRLDISCSHGTYIRRLASDLGNRLGSMAHLSFLRRLSSEPFRVDNAMNSRSIDISMPADLLREKIVPLQDALPHMEEFPVDPGMAKRIRNGYRPQWKEIAGGKPLASIPEGLIKIIHGRSLVAVIELNPLPHDQDWLKKIRVFN